MRYYYFTSECPEGKERFPLTADPFDAARAADGCILCRVEIRERDGEIIVRRIDATEIIREFSRMQASAVLAHWASPPDEVVRFLKTGSESLRDLARAAAAAARDAAEKADAAADATAASAAIAAASVSPEGDTAYAAADAASWAVAYANAASWHTARTEFLKRARDQFLEMVEEAFG